MQNKGKKMETASAEEDKTEAAATTIAVQLVKKHRVLEVEPRCMTGHIPWEKILSCIPFDDDEIPEQPT